MKGQINVFGRPARLGAVAIGICLGLTLQLRLSAQQPADTSAVKSIEATDQESGIHYLRLSVTAKADDDAEPPRLTMECRQDKRGKKDLFWYVSFGHVPEQGFEPPFRSNQGNPFPPRLPREKIILEFDGYMKSKPFPRVWELKPWGELWYCNPGMDCPNLDGPRQMLVYLRALPTLRLHGSVAGQPKQAVFATKPLLDAMHQSPICGW